MCLVLFLLMRSLWYWLLPIPDDPQVTHLPCLLADFQLSDWLLCLHLAPQHPPPASSPNHFFTQHQNELLKTRLEHVSLLPQTLQWLPIAPGNTNLFLPLHLLFPLLETPFPLALGLRSYFPSRMQLKYHSLREAFPDHCVLYSHVFCLTSDPVHGLIIYTAYSAWNYPVYRFLSLFPLLPVSSYSICALGVCGLCSLVPCVAWAAQAPPWFWHTAGAQGGFEEEVNGREGVTGRKLRAREAMVM